MTTSPTPRIWIVGDVDHAFIARALGEVIGAQPADVAGCAIIDDRLNFTAVGGDAGVQRPLDGDAFVVVGPDIAPSVRRLLNRGCRLIFDGNRILAAASPVRHLIERASFAYLGQDAAPSLPGSDEDEELVRPHLAPGSVPRERLFIVNSLPKAGTIWMATLLRRLLRPPSDHQILISHMGDYDSDRLRPYVQGVVGLVRDVRDVVISWFHHAQRMDHALGYAAPRFASIDAFYFGPFLGMLRRNPRFLGGDLLGWTDRLYTDFIPVFRYEDLRSNTAAVMTAAVHAMRISATPEAIQGAVEACRFDAVKAQSHAAQTGDVNPRSSYLNWLISSGHLRRGEPGEWRDALPDAIAEDIADRFGDFQRRFGYA